MALTLPVEFDPEVEERFLGEGIECTYCGLVRVVGVEIEEVIGDGEDICAACTEVEKLLVSQCKGCRVGCELCCEEDGGKGDCVGGVPEDSEGPVRI